MKYLILFYIFLTTQRWVHQYWKYAVALYLASSATGSIRPYFGDLLSTICNIPPSGMDFICHAWDHHSSNTQAYSVTVDDRFRSLEDLFSSVTNLSVSTSLADVQMSVDDAVFVVKSSKMDRQNEIVEELDRLGLSSVEVNHGLMHFRAQAFSAVDL